MKLQTWFVRINAFVFLVYGLGFAWAPAQWSIWVAGTAPTDPAALIDMRATYGGMSIGFGLLLAGLAHRVETLRLGVWGVLLMLGGMGLTRLLGLLMTGSHNLTMWIYFAFEISLTLIAALLLKRVKV